MSGACHMGTLESVSGPEGHISSTAIQRPEGRCFLHSFLNHRLQVHNVWVEGACSLHVGWVRAFPPKQSLDGAPGNSGRKWRSLHESWGGVHVFLHLTIVRHGRVIICESGRR